VNEPELAKLIRVERRGLFIDGEVFPWFVASDSIDVSVSPHESPSVTFTVLAERVEVVDEWDTA
jgi:hypothetical protein